MIKYPPMALKPQGNINNNRAIIFFALSMIIALSSCSTINYLKYVFTSRITVQQAIDKKIKMDEADNPAYKLLVIRDLAKKRIKIEKAAVKDIVASSNIDYSFCVVVSVETTRGPIDCHVYANDLYQQEDIRTISRLVKNKTVIDIDGDFKRFFSLLDDTYTKIEIINARISILDK